MTRKIVKKLIALSLVIISVIPLFTVYSSAHSLSSWAKKYPAESANSTYSFGIFNATHVNGNNVKYYWSNSTAKSNFNSAVTGAFSTAWKNLITGTEVSSSSSANLKIEYDPINQPTNVAAMTYGSSADQHTGVGTLGARIVFYKDSKDYSGNSKRILAAHELGHLWGIDDLYDYSETLDSIYSHLYDFTYATRHDRNAMRICLSDLWYNPGNNQVWLYQPSPGTFIKRADVNQDGKITSADARMILRFSAQLEEPTDLQLILSDVNGDGVITSADARLVNQYAAQLISKFPADVYEG